MAYRGQSGRSDRANITNPNDANFQSNNPLLHQSSVYGLSLCIQFLINMSRPRSLRSHSPIVMFVMHKAGPNRSERYHPNRRFVPGRAAARLRTPLAMIEAHRLK